MVKYYKRKKRNTKKRNTHVTYIPRQPISKSLISKLKYCEHGFVTPPATTFLGFNTVYRANSCFDPRYALGGHQPIGFDNWSEFYREYVVLSSKITVRFASSTVQPTVVGVGLRDDANEVSNGSMTLFCERGHSKTRMLARNDSTTITSYFNAKTQYNIKDPSGDADLTASIDNNPVQECFFVMQIGRIADDVISSDRVAFETQIEYTVMFKEPKALLQS